MPPSPRKKKPARAWKAAYRRRDQRARDLGYKNYYDYRAHGNGATPPSAPRSTGNRLRVLRGHASGADLIRAAGRGGFVIATLGGRDGIGRYTRVDVTLIADDGSETDFLLRGKQLEKDYLAQLVDDLERAGVTFSPNPSGDLRQIAD